MSKHDSHPEAWLDRDHGQLREDEQLELERHLGQCDACALHDKLKPSLMEQLALLPGDALLINGAIDQAVRGFATASPPPALNVVRPGRLLAMTAAGALAVGSAGVAGVWAVGSKPSWTPPAATAVPPAKTGQPVVGAPVTPAAPEQGRESPELLPAPELATDPTTDAPHETRIPTAPPRTSGSARAAAAATAPPSSALRNPATATDTAGAPETSAELFARANSLRRSKEYSDAERLYRRLQSAFSGSPEVMLSRIVLGRMYLDQLGDPRAALRQFDAYLASATHTSLRDEAMIGRALAFGRLGRNTEERTAWLRFLDAYPGSMYVPKAKARLKELGE